MTTWQPIETQRQRVLDSLKSIREVRYLQQDGRPETREPIRATLEQKVDIALAALEVLLDAPSTPNTRE